MNYLRTLESLNFTLKLYLDSKKRTKKLIFDESTCAQWIAPEGVKYFVCEGSHIDLIERKSLNQSNEVIDMLRRA